MRPVLIVDTESAVVVPRSDSRLQPNTVGSGALFTHNWLTRWVLRWITRIDPVKSRSRYERNAVP